MTGSTVSFNICTKLNHFLKPSLKLSVRVDSIKDRQVKWFSTIAPANCYTISKV